MADSLQWEGVRRAKHRRHIDDGSSPSYIFRAPSTLSSSFEASPKVRVHDRADDRASYTTDTSSETVIIMFSKLWRCYLELERDDGDEGNVTSSQTSSQTSTLPAPVVMDSGDSTFGVSSESRTLAVVVTTAVTTLSVFFFFRYVLYPKWRSVIPSPLRASFPKVSPEVLEKQVYKPDCLPGARDVPTLVSFFLSLWSSPRSLSLALPLSRSRQGSDERPCPPRAP